MERQPRPVAAAALFLCFLGFSSAYAEVPTPLEPEYAEAVLAYNGRNYDRALKVLDELIKSSPQTIEFLELKALTLKSALNAKESAQAYIELIRAKREMKAPEKETAPYRFELAMIYFRADKMAPAKQQLLKALEFDFNVGASHFFLGLIAFKEAKWAEADRHFSGVTTSNAADLKPAAYFYRAQIAAKTAYPAGATQNFAAAQESAEAFMKDPEANPETKKIAQQIYDASAKALEPLNKNQWFGNVALLTSYDSNVLSIPNSVDAADATGKATVKEVLQLGLGYMTSPLSTIQFVPNYRGSFNYNFNRDSRAGEFISNTLALYVTRKPLSPFNLGLKLEGTYTFQNDVDPTTDKGTYRPFLFALSTGPYAKWEVGRKKFIGMEVFLGPQSFEQDDEQTATTKRSGTLVSTRAFWQNDNGDRFWNPSVSLTYTINSTDGSEFRSSGFTGGLSDLLYISDTTKLSLALTYALTSYPDRPIESRNDKTLTFQAALTKRINRRLTFLSDLSYTNNASNITDTYTYNRFAVSAGVSYSLL